jgi:hypothetical protein
MEFRIYYECLEQANDYIKPLVSSSVDGDVDIRLIRRVKSASAFNSGAVGAIQYLVTPDIMITGVKDNKEYPLIIIEISEAVTTEDHELQRTYGAISAYFANTFYIKISGNKKSDKVFGGADYNAYSTPRIFIDSKNFEGYLIAEWPLTQNSDTLLVRNQEFLSCPQSIELLNDSINCIIKSFINTDQGWYASALESLKTKPSYIKFVEKVNQAAGLEQLMNSWRTRVSSNPNKLRFHIKSDFIGAKINRFDHAMDPDRGVLTFISFFCSGDHKVYGIYALVRERSNDVLKRRLSTMDDLKEKLNAAFVKDKGGIPGWLQNYLTLEVAKLTAIDETLDITDFILTKKKEIDKNKVLITLFYFLDGIFLNHNGIKIIWNRSKILGDENADALELVRSHFNFDLISEPNSIKIETNEVNEDEVTYILIHKILRPNGFKIISVSYPGAQGSSAILPNPTKGKAQDRLYADVIASLPHNSENIDINVLLNESKGMFSKASINNDVTKILNYKQDPLKKLGLSNMLIKANVIDTQDKLKDILIGVSFGINSSTYTDWNPADIDFMMIIVDREHWKIGVFNQKLFQVLTNIEGNTEFPIIYRLERANDRLST